MSERAVLVLVLLSVTLRCQCQQRFVELPFDDSEASSGRFANQEPVRFNQIPSANQQFSSFNPVSFQNQNPVPVATPAPAPLFSAASSFPDFNTRNIQQQVKGNSRHVSSLADSFPFPTPQSNFESRPQFTQKPLGQLIPFTARQPVQTHPTRQQFPSFVQGPIEVQQKPTHPTRQQFPSFVQRPIEVQQKPTFPTDEPVQLPARNLFSNHEFLNSHIPQQQRHNPIQQPQNAFFSVEEPTFTTIGHSQRRPPQQQLPVRPPPPVTQSPRLVPQQQPILINEQPSFQNIQPRFSSIQPNFERRNQQDLEEKIFRQQAENAKYSFSSQIDDSISGNQHDREETRDGLAVKGKYSYSDGYVKRTVHYEADEKGYRVVKEDDEPLGSGPKVNPNGQANVSSFISGNSLQYSITGADIQENQKNLAPQPQHQPQRSFRNFVGSNDRF